MKFYWQVIPYCIACAVWGYFVSEYTEKMNKSETFNNTVGIIGCLVFLGIYYFTFLVNL